MVARDDREGLSENFDYLSLALPPCPVRGSRLNSAHYDEIDHHSASWPSTYWPGVNASGRPAAWPGLRIEE